MKVLMSTLAILVVAILAQDYAVCETVNQNGKVTDVTLYRNQARVTRTIASTDKTGELELVVSELPENIVPDSLFAEADPNVEIRAVQFRTRAVRESPRDDVRELQEKIHATQREIALNQKLTGLLTKQRQYLDKMENFVAPTATAELTSGVLDAEALEKITSFNFDQREQIAKKEISLGNELHDLQQQLALLNRRLAEISNNQTKSVLEAVLFVRKNDSVDSNIRLSYLVNSCGWSPSYTVRAVEDNAKASIEYNGLIRQMSGEDWTNVKLTLSTATPAMSSSGPGLAPFSINLVPNSVQQANQQVQANFKLQNMEQLKNFYNDQQNAISAVQRSFNIKDNNSNSWGLNRAVNDLACLELTTPETGNVSSAEIPDEIQQPCLSYELDSPVNLTSRDSQQMVRILQSELPGDFYYVAAPVLTRFVFREAAINNSGEADFLAGPITVYLDGRFVGRGEIPTVARGQSFVIGLGADSQLRTRRELVGKDIDINGGNREVSVDYRLIVENYKASPVKVRITDRLPKPLNKNDIRVTMLNPKKPLSEDMVYKKMERPHGILRWDAEVPAGSIGEDVYEISYGYSMEFDRKYQIALASDQSDELMQFEEIQARRIKR